MSKHTIAIPSIALLEALEQTPFVVAVTKAAHQMPLVRIGALLEQSDIADQDNDMAVKDGAKAAAMAYLIAAAADAKAKRKCYPAPHYADRLHALDAIGRPGAIEDTMFGGTLLQDLTDVVFAIGAVYGMRIAEAAGGVR